MHTGEIVKLRPSHCTESYLKQFLPFSILFSFLNFRRITLLLRNKATTYDYNFKNIFFSCNHSDDKTFTMFFCFIKYIIGVLSNWSMTKVWTYFLEDFQASPKWHLYCIRAWVLGILNEFKLTLVLHFENCLKQNFVIHQKIHRNCFVMDASQGYFFRN